MRIRLLIAIWCSLWRPLAGSTGPDDRPITDPHSVVSAPNPAARPAPVDDLYYTRSVFGAAWSPDGQQIVFTTDISGRSNLWKVRASGGWPIQLSQSDEPAVQRRLVTRRQMGRLPTGPRGRRALGPLRNTG